MRHALVHRLLPLAALCTAMAAQAASAPPSAVMTTGVFTEFVGFGPVGVNDQQTDGTLYWRRESSGLLYQGQAVESWYVFYDPATTGDVVQGSVTFASNVLFTFTNVNGIISTNAYRDPEMGYHFSMVSGFVPEADLEANDLANTVISGNTIILRWDSTGPDDGDYMRVFTAAPVPEPATWISLSLGLAVLGRAAMNRRRVTASPTA